MKLTIKNINKIHNQQWYRNPFGIKHIYNTTIQSKTEGMYEIRVFIETKQMERSAVGKYYTIQIHRRSDENKEYPIKIFEGGLPNVSITQSGEGITLEWIKKLIELM